MSIKLTLDSKNNRIRIEETEVKPNCDIFVPAEDFKLNLNNSAYNDLGFVLFSSVDIGHLDFEGFVLELIDKDGNSFLTEIPGLAN